MKLSAENPLPEPAEMATAQQRATEPQWLNRMRIPPGMTLYAVHPVTLEVTKPEPVRTSAVAGRMFTSADFAVRKDIAAQKGVFYTAALNEKNAVFRFLRWRHPQMDKKEIRLFVGKFLKEKAHTGQTAGG